MSIKINRITKEDTAYSKHIQFTYEGENYSVILYWDRYDGYEVSFTEIGKTRNCIDEPEWAINWEDNNEESLAYTLDNLTDEVLESEGE